MNGREPERKAGPHSNAGPGARLGMAAGATIRTLRLPWVWVPLVFLTAGVVGFGWGAWRNLCADCPSIAQIHTWEPQQTSKVFSHDGELLAELGIERRTPISFHALPDHVPQAFVAIEDRRFYRHQGVDPRGISRAALLRVIPRPVTRAVGLNLRTGGGSTITQQLARNMFVESIGFDVSIERKLKELQVSLELERAYSKEHILEAYMNQINLGRGIWGIHTASRYYFGKMAVEVNPAEAALLAAVANNPGRYNPFANPETSRGRRNLVLNRMAVEGFLTQEEARNWQAHPLPTEPAEVVEGLAPYFVDWVRQEVMDRFPGQVNTGGFRIFTTLDIDMQRAAEEAMRWGFQRIEDRPNYLHPTYEEFEDHTEGFPGATTPYLQGAFVALDPATGHVRALVGGRDFEQSRFNRAVQAYRQAGSAFKTFVYAAALANGIPASRIIADGPVVRAQVDGTEWRPRNFSGEFEGDMTLREAYRRSINTVAIKLADEEVGLETVVQAARRLGVESAMPRVPSIAIGAADVRPIEMAEAYSAFANGGTRVRPYPILRVENAEGVVLWEPQPETTPVMDPLSTRLMVSLMEDVVTWGTAASAVRVVAGLPREIPAAGKTGTTNNNTDVWFVGFTPTLQATVWFGMDRPQRIHADATGGGFAAPVWGRFMRRVYTGEVGDDANTDVALSGAENGREPMLPIPEPWSTEGLLAVEVDDRTGLLASPWCPAERRYTELFIPGTEPTQECDDSAARFRAPGWPW